METVGLYLYSDEIEQVNRIRVDIAKKYKYSFRPKIDSVLIMCVEEGLNNLKKEEERNKLAVQTRNRNYISGTIHNQNRRRYNIYLEDDLFSQAMEWGYNNYMFAKTDIFRALIRAGLASFSAEK